MFKSLMFNFLDIKSGEYVNFQNAVNTWPYKVKSFDELPQAYKKVYPPYTNSFPYTIIIPDEYYSFFKKKGFMIAIIENKLYIYEKLGSEVKSATYQGHDIQYLITGASMLHSWITIVSQNDFNTFSYNSVMGHLFQPIIEKFRNIEGSSDEIIDENEKLFSLHEFQNEPLTKNLKFRNLIRHYFIIRRKILSIVFQPNYLFSFKQFPLFNLKIFKRYISNHLMLLTSDELIFIRENKIIEKKIRPSYDYIFTFIHKKNIDAYELLNEERNNLKKLVVTLKNGTCFYAYFSKDNPQLDLFTNALGKKYFLKQKGEVNLK